MRDQDQRGRFRGNRQLQRRLCQMEAWEARTMSRPTHNNERQKAQQGHQNELCDLKRMI